MVSARAAASIPRSLDPDPDPDRKGEKRLTFIPRGLIREEHLWPTVNDP